VTTGKQVMQADTDKFIDSFVETGDYLVSMREAGFNDRNPYKLKLQGKALVIENKDEIDRKFHQRLREGGPRALTVIERLMDSDSDTVKLNAAKEILDRGGYKAFNDIDPSRTIEELDAQLVALVGKDGAKMLVAAFRSRKVITGPTMN